MSKMYQPRWESLFVEADNHEFCLREEKELATDETPESQLQRSESAKEIRAALQNIPPRSREVMIRRYGFRGEPQSLVEIGQSLGVSKQRVSQWEMTAREELRIQLKDRKTRNET